MEMPCCTFYLKTTEVTPSVTALANSVFFVLFKLFFP